jgi:hypothetical protein
LGGAVVAFNGGQKGTSWALIHAHTLIFDLAVNAEIQAKPLGRVVVFRSVAGALILADPVHLVLELQAIRALSQTMRSIQVVIWQASCALIYVDWVTCTASVGASHT